MIVSFHLQRFYIWILIFHHQPIRPPSHQRGRDPPVMASGADSLPQLGTRSETGGLWFRSSGHKGFHILAAGAIPQWWHAGGRRGVQAARGPHGAPRYPWEGFWWSAANRQPETTFSHKVREVSNQEWCHRRSSMGIVGGIGPDHRNSGSAARQRGPGPKHV